MDYYNHTRQPICRRNQSNCSPMYQANPSTVYSASSQSDESCPYHGLDRLPLAMSYVPWQQWNNLYDPSKGLWIGTIFQELDLPFCERSCLNP